MKTALGSIGRVLPLCSLLALGACHDDRGPPAYAVEVSVSGLSGSGLVLSDGQGDDIPVAANGAFAFPAHSKKGDAYAVTVKTQPGGPAQSCSVSNGAGTFANGNVTTVSVACVDLTGHFAYADHFEDSGISVFAVQADGSLGAVSGSPFDSGLGDQEVFQLALSPSGRFLVAGASSDDNTKNDVAVLEIDRATGALTPVAGSPFPTETGAGSGYLSFDRTGKFLYSANYVSNDVTAFSVDPSTGALTKVPGSPFPVGTSPTNIAVDPSNKFVLVANGGSNDVTVFALNAVSGALTPVAGSPFAAGEFPTQPAFGAGGQFVYVTNLGSTGDEADSSTTAYTLDPTTGALTQLAGSPFAVHSNSFLATDSAGTLLLAPTSFLGLSSYRIDAATGGLTVTAGSPHDPGGNVSQGAVDPSDRYYYLSRTEDKTVAVYAIDASTGELTPISGSPFAVNSEPYSIVVD